MKDNFESALEFAIAKHKGQLDKGWTPYIQHLLGVWSRVRDASLTTQIVALLHDSIEDTDTTYEELVAEFGQTVADAVRILTHQRGLKYEAYINNIALSDNPYAILVKLADLEDNSSKVRLQRLSEEMHERFIKRIEEKYNIARAHLKAALGETK